MLTFQPPFQGSQTAVIRKAETRLLVCGPDRGDDGYLRPGPLTWFEASPKRIRCVDHCVPYTPQIPEYSTSFLDASGNASIYRFERWSNDEQGRVIATYRLLKTCRRDEASAFLNDHYDDRISFPEE